MKATKKSNRRGRPAKFYVFSVPLLRRQRKAYDAVAAENGVLTVELVRRVMDWTLSDPSRVRSIIETTPRTEGARG
jgi:hypothetical protein